MAIDLLCSNNDREVAHSSVSNTPLHERDPAISGEDNIHSIVSDTSLGGVTTKHTDTQQDHTYSAAEFHRQTHNNELPEYNTLQHGNAANTQIDSNSVLGTYNKIDLITRKDPQKCSKVSKQLQRNTHMTDAIHIYDDVETAGQTKRRQLIMSQFIMNLTTDMSTSPLVSMCSLMMKHMEHINQLLREQL